MHQMRIIGNVPITVEPKLKEDAAEVVLPSCSYYREITVYTRQNLTTKLEFFALNRPLVQSLQLLLKQYFLNYLRPRDFPQMHLP